MRYQKWGKGGYKIYCYSQDKGKPHLRRSECCDNHKIWADELETAVISDLFSMSSKDIKDDSGSVQSKSVEELLSEQLRRLQKKLKNLYHLYGDSSDETLLEAISEAKKELSDAEHRLEEAERESDRLLRQQQTREALTSAESAWEYLTLKEKQNVLRSCIERIVITYDKTEIYYKIPVSPE